MVDGSTLVTIVCPAYQEEEVLPLFHAELCAVLAGLDVAYRFEIIYVDDGSRDSTLRMIKRFARHDPHVRYLALTRNFGHQAALSAGLAEARGDVVVCMDVDLQHPPALLPRLLQKWQEGYEVVITRRQDDPRLSLFKRVTSSAFYRVMALFCDVEVGLGTSDFRLISRKALQALLNLHEYHRFLRGMVQWLGFPAAEVWFTPDARRAGQSKYTLRRMLRLAADGLFSFSRLPLQLPLYLGLMVLALGAIHLGWCALQVMSGEVLSWSVHYLIFVAHVLGGGILLSLGLLGEYLGRVHEQVKQRPMYVIRESSPEPGALPARRVPVQVVSREVA